MNYVRLQFSRQNVEDLLHERGVDNNHATVMFMTLVAQQEREAISRRTKEALAAATARKLGSPMVHRHSSGQGRVARRCGQPLLSTHTLSPIR